MLFCDLDLAARIERAEARFSTRAQVARRLEGVLAEPIGGGVAAYTEPGSPLNKVCGLGFADNFDEQAFEALEREHARRGVGLQVELATLADPKIARWLTSRGFELVGVENVLGRDLSGFTANTAFPDVRIARSEPHELDLWLDVVVTGFAAPDTQGVAAHQEFGREVLERVIRDFASAERVVRYLARIETSRRRWDDAHLRRHRTALRSLDPARAATTRRAECPARASARRGSPRRLQRRRRDDPTGLEVPTERPASWVRAPVRAQRARARSAVTGRALGRAPSSAREQAGSRSHVSGRVRARIVRGSPRLESSAGTPSPACAGVRAGIAVTARRLAP
jgi:hypothetical protein